MYKVQNKPDSNVRLASGGTVEPLVTLKDEYGGVSHIIQDGGCYVLVNGSLERLFVMVKHWYPEAVDALVAITKDSNTKGQKGKNEERRKKKKAL